MAQQQRTEDTESVQDRIESLAEKSERAEKLAEDVDDIEKKRERASNKNDAFEDLERKIANTREQYQQLELWTEYADRMGVEIPKDGILDRRSDIERKLQSLTRKTWDDFHDASDVRDIVAEFEKHREALRDFTRAVREAVQDEVDEELEAVERTQTLLQIPDIGDDEAEKICREYRYYLNKLADGKPSDDVTPEKWESYHGKFAALDIDLGEDLTDDAKDVIWDLLEDKTVTLAEIDEAVLDDLKTFEEFSKRLSIQFTTNP